jgi:hypothetical protein
MLFGYLYLLTLRSTSRHCHTLLSKVRAEWSHILQKQMNVEFQFQQPFQLNSRTELSNFKALCSEVTSYTFTSYCTGSLG